MEWALWACRGQPDGQILVVVSGYLYLADTRGCCSPAWRAAAPDRSRRACGMSLGVPGRKVFRAWTPLPHRSVLHLLAQTYTGENLTSQPARPKKRCCYILLCCALCSHSVLYAEQKRMDGGTAALDKTRNGHGQCSLFCPKDKMLLLPLLWTGKYPSFSLADLWIPRWETVSSPIKYCNHINRGPINWI